MKLTLMAAALLAPSIALAQQANDDGAVVIDVALTEDVVDTTPADTVIVTASRSREGIELDRLGGSATVIATRDLEARQVRVISDLLRDVPGVAVSRSGAVGNATEIRLRGSESNHVLVLIDGIEVSDPFQGEYDFGNLIADDAARIEVLRGQQSALYGSDAIGGVIQYQTLSGLEVPGVRLRAEGGSFGTFAGGARIADVAGAFDYALNATYLNTGGYPTARGGERDIGAETVAASFKAGWSPSNSFRLSAVGRYARTDSDFNDAGENPALPGFFTIVDTPGVRSETEAFYALVRADIGGGQLTGAISAQIADTERKALDGRTLSFGNEGRRYKGSAEATARFGGGAARHKLTVALDLERESYRNTTQSPFVFQGERSVENLGLVGQYELALGEDVNLGASIRYDENDRFDDPVTVRAQASWRVATGTRLRAAGGTGIKNPGFLELFGFSDGRFIGNPDLEPERSEGFEIGVDQELGFATLGLTYFDSTLKNEIFTTFPPPDFTATPANRETDSEQRGIEAFVSSRAGERLRIDAAYTYLDAEENGVREVRRPRHLASANLVYGRKDGPFSATLTARYNGRQRDLAFTPPFFASVPVSLDDFVLINIAAEYRLDRFTVFGRVENVADENYEEVFGYRGQGAAAYAGVRARF